MKTLTVKRNRYVLGTILAFTLLLTGCAAEEEVVRPDLTTPVVKCDTKTPTTPATDGELDPEAVGSEENVTTKLDDEKKAEADKKTATPTPTGTGTPAPDTDKKDDKADKKCADAEVEVGKVVDPPAETTKDSGWNPGTTTPTPTNTKPPVSTNGGNPKTPKPTPSPTPPNPDPTNTPKPTPTPTPTPTKTPTPTTPESFVPLFHEEFTGNAATGSWSQQDVTMPAYYGAGGVNWFAAPSTIQDTNNNPYRPEAVISVHNGVIDINPKNVDGLPAGAVITPAVSGSETYQTYGKYEFQMKTTGPTNPYRLTTSLQPLSGVAASDGAIIFPDQILTSSNNLTGYYIYGGTGCAENGCAIQTVPVSNYLMTSTHTYTVEWTPTRLTYKLDGQTVLEMKSNVPTKPMRFQIAVNSTSLNSDDDTADTHVLVSDVKIWSYKAGTK